MKYTNEFRLIDGAKIVLLPKCAYCKKYAPKCQCGKTTKGDHGKT